MLKKALHIVKKEAASNERGGMVSFVASSDAPDRYSDVIDQRGWQLDNYNKNNPIILLNHNPNSLPIGRGFVEVRNGNLEIDIEFDVADDGIAKEISRKVDAGFLHSVSVGFRALESTQRSKLDTENKYSGTEGLYFTKCELLEVSIDQNSYET